MARAIASDINGYPVVNRKAGKDEKWKPVLPALSALPVQRFFPTGCCRRPSSSRVRGLRVSPDLELFPRDLRSLRSADPNTGHRRRLAEGVPPRFARWRIPSAVLPSLSSDCSLFVSLVCFVGPLGPARSYSPRPASRVRGLRVSQRFGNNAHARLPPAGNSPVALISAPEISAGTLNSVCASWRPSSADWTSTPSRLPTKKHEKPPKLIHPTCRSPADLKRPRLRSADSTLATGGD